jgi:hypothetical protein
MLWAVARNAHRIRAFAYLSVRDPRPALADLAGFWRAPLRQWLSRTVLPPTSPLGRPSAEDRLVARTTRGSTLISVSPSATRFVRAARFYGAMPAGRGVNIIKFA